MMEKDPDKRYQAAGSVAQDLRRYVNRFAISARRVGAVGRVVRWAKRNRATAAALFVVVLLSLIAGVLAYREHLARQQVLQERVERAMLVAMGGDLDGAEKAIAEAEVLDASPGSVRMIRGLLAFHRGDARQAISHLQQVVKILPRSVAAHSLLAEAYAAEYQWDRYEIILRDAVEKLPAVTPEDFLFKGHAEAATDPRRGLKTLDEAIRRWPNSPIARVLHAEARSFLAEDTGNIEMAQSAIDDAHVARVMMPGNRKVIEIELWAHLVAMGIFRDAGEKDRATASLLQAGKDAQELERFPALPKSYLARWHYLNLNGQDQAAYEVARQGYQEAGRSLITLSIYVYSLYERGEFEKAIQVLGFGPLWLQVFILAEMPDGLSRALQAYRLNFERPSAGHSVIADLAPLLFLGRNSDAKAAGRELRRHPERLTGISREHMLRILDYCEGVISEEDFLKADAGSRWNQCEAHFCVALDRLSQGERADAREHFQKAVAPGVFGFRAYQLSRLFLKRMEQDPNWPPWIPQQEPATRPTPNQQG